MTATPNPAASPAAAPQAEPPLTINIQYIRDLSFENPNAPQIFAPSEMAPSLNLGVNVQTKPVAENAFEVVLILKLEAALEGKTAFIAELSYAGIFTVVAGLPEAQLKFLLMAEAPRYLFPFARGVLSNAMRDGGFPQILIHPIDFVSLYQQNADKLQTTTGSA